MMEHPDVISLHPDLLSALRERGHSDDEIARMKPAKAFREFCEWHGLIDWAPTLMSVYEAAKAQLPIKGILS